MKNLIVFFAAVVVFTLLLMVPELVQAQPPGLPDAPDQAPLGGLGILAAAGGAYAWKKLRNRSQE